MNGTILPAALALAGAMSISFGGCISLTTQNYYTENPQARGAVPAGGQLAGCGCPGTMPPYQAGVSYPQQNGGVPYVGQPGYPSQGGQGYPAGYYTPDGVYHAPDVVYYPVPYYGGAPVGSSPEVVYVPREEEDRSGTVSPGSSGTPRGVSARPRGGVTQSDAQAASHSGGLASMGGLAPVGAAAHSDTPVAARQRRAPRDSGASRRDNGEREVATGGAAGGVTASRTVVHPPLVRNAPVVAVTTSNQPVRVTSSQTSAPSPSGPATIASGIPSDVKVTAASHTKVQVGEGKASTGAAGSITAGGTVALPMQSQKSTGNGAKSDTVQRKRGAVLVPSRAVTPAPAEMAKKIDVREGAAGPSVEAAASPSVESPR